MFKRMATSLTKPPLAVFFMKDSWGRAILYLFWIPLWLIIPTLINVAANPGMSVNRYEYMIDSITENIMDQNAVISEGFLTYDVPAKTTFEYFSIYVGDQIQTRETLNFVLEEQHITLYMSNMEVSKTLYSDLELTNFDFNNDSESNVRIFAAAIKTIYDQQRSIQYMDVFLAYFLGLFDYVLIVLFMSALMMLFVAHVKLPYRYRLKLSIYLSTIYAISFLVFTLFKAYNLDFISVALVSMYHIWAFRSMKVVNDVVIP